ncbi:NrdH-redoxin [Arthrobacter sp. STN4]|uniref:NrdH-redoxin n=1 Tax=Arthrobacter sp. STN4 TaxID=2923276 RepID=UPI002119EDE1|nr:NrdH-redoxin [Arthrobacter sp. STN4]MCQ9162944.1 NrdH-redoxin [Arthrobacter sp. STN4]
MSNNPASASVTIVSNPRCVQCKATYRDLARHSIPHAIDEDVFSPDHALALSLGHSQAPVVLVRDSATGILVDHWSGFQPDRIASLKPTLQSTATEAA